MFFKFWFYFRVHTLCLGGKDVGGATGRSGKIGVWGSGHFGVWGKKRTLRSNWGLGLVWKILGAKTFMFCQTQILKTQT